MSISRLEASCNRVGVTSGKFATTQTTPPDAAALTQRATAACTPQHSKQTSNLSPTFLSMTDSSSGSSARKGYSTPSSAAFRSFASTMSVMVTEAAPAALAQSKPNGASPADEDVHADTHLRPGHSLQGHAHGLQHGPLLQGNVFGQLVAVRGGMVEDLAQGARYAVDSGANEPHSGAKVVAALATSLAVSARNTRLHRHAVSNLQVGHLLAHGRDRACALVAHLAAVALAEAG
eukprot:CAMPEP_0113837264 /NCGR_PEP_ID=MMETSP0328-20130328/9911_1 /TAXON_ID=39455 /ORGANISM="Alexandrium minutum" /LENGTH=233 /DNA_ID=CAMNT_0000805715 /DNA_START=105 /DNA_END=803 /DNA_ORIENTATION=+ /assembly_acc=CAM_ASM_000350